MFIGDEIQQRVMVNRGFVRRQIDVIAMRYVVVRHDNVDRTIGRANFECIGTAARRSIRPIRDELKGIDNAGSEDASPYAIFTPEPDGGGDGSRRIHEASSVSSSSWTHQADRR